MPDDRALYPDDESASAPGQESWPSIAQDLGLAHQRARRCVVLATPAGASSKARDINRHGHIVGSIRWSDDEAKAALWENGRLTILETPAGWQSRARAINDGGQIVGAEYTRVSWQNPWGHQQDSQVTRAIVWENGGRRELDQAGNASTEALALNNRGQIVGKAFVPKASRPAAESASGLWIAGSEIVEVVAVLWQDECLIELEPLAHGATVFDQANAINNQGLIAGESRFQPVVWRDGRPNRLDFSTPADPADSGNATSINDLGVVVGRANCRSLAYFNEEGWSDTILGMKHVRWHRGDVTDIALHQSGDHEGEPRLNNLGQVVGVKPVSPDLNRAYLWQDGHSTVLATPSNGASYASATNDRGQIAGGCEDADGVWRACLWE
jgi:uncharacterized membrane protein